jgi:FlaA1/EpsC-like NDP-sugar epimerase
MLLSNKTVLVTGGTGSLGKVLVSRLLTGEMGEPKKIIIYSRDEAKQHQMQMDYYSNLSAKCNKTSIDVDIKNKLDFRIGDIRDYNSVIEVLKGVDVVFNTAALKQVPTCEYFPFQAVLTNIIGAENIVRAIHDYSFNIETVIGISTDKACKPVNVMGMTKSIQERIFIQANIRCPNTRFVCVRYGNVLASRGSVIPLFIDQIRKGGPVTITTPDMTRFLISLDHAVDTIFAAYSNGNAGETYIPRVPSARVVDIANAMIGKLDIKTVITGIRPGEKIHEILISEEECNRVADRQKFYAVLPMLEELKPDSNVAQVLVKEYSSADNVLSLEETASMLEKYNIIPLVNISNNSEFIK